MTRLVRLSRIIFLLLVAMIGGAGDNREWIIRKNEILQSVAERMRETECHFTNLAVPSRFPQKFRCLGTFLRDALEKIHASQRRAKWIFNIKLINRNRMLYL